MDVELILLTDVGCEQACAKELLGYTSATPTLSAGALRLTLELLDACEIAYSATTIRRALIALAAPLPSLDALSSSIPERSLIDALLPKDATFKVAGEVLAATLEGKSTQVIHQQELIETIAAWIFPHLKRKVDLAAPDATIYASMVGGTIHIGYDLFGTSLSQREWRVMLSRRSLKATIAASAAIYAGLTPKDRILDPIADDGTLVIESALLLTRTSPRKFLRTLPFSSIPALAGTSWSTWRERRSPRTVAYLGAYSQGLREMNAVRTNSKLAGVASAIHSTRITIDWVDLKTEERSFDKILTHPLESGKSVPEQKARKMQDDLFSQAGHLLSRNGTVTCVCAKPQELLESAAHAGFAVRERHRVLMGLLTLEIITFGRGS